jgi:hypothetical protein
VSSRRRLCALVLAVLALVLGALLAGCGKDREVVRESAEQSPASSSSAPTTDTDLTVPTTQETSTTAARRRRARKHKQHAQKRRHKPTTTTQTTSTPTTTSPTPSGKTHSKTHVQAPRSTPKKHVAKPKQPPASTVEAGPPAHSIAESATLQLVSKQGLRAYVHEGAVQGTLNGQMHLETKLGGAGVVATFTVTLPDGTLIGRGSASLTLADSQARFSGTATITGGTGAYDGATGSGLKFKGAVASDASTCSVRMSGSVHY